MTLEELIRHNPRGVAWGRRGGVAVDAAPSVTFEVDHIEPVVLGGTDDPANLRLLCRPCHTAVTRQQRRVA